MLVDLLDLIDGARFSWPSPDGSPSQTRTLLLSDDTLDSVVRSHIEQIEAAYLPNFEPVLEQLTVYSRVLASSRNERIAPYQLLYSDALIRIRAMRDVGTGSDDDDGDPGE